MNINNGESNGAEIESPFDETENQKAKYTRPELIKKTGKELAKMAQEKSPLQLTTLERLKKADLCDIILDIKKPEDTKSKARASTAKSESDNIIDFALTTLQSIKQARKGQDAVINPIALNIFKNSAVSKVDEARASGTLDSDKLNTTIFAVSSAVILVDTLVGFDKIPSIFNKLKDKFKKKNETNTK